MYIFDLTATYLARTNVSPRSSRRTIIIDTKYYQKTLTENYGKERFRSEHLYQIFAYLKNLEKRKEPDCFAEGILLYPTVSTEYAFKVQERTYPLEN